jgi:hypothetical protein
MRIQERLEMMLSGFFDWFMGAFAVILVLAVLAKPIHTGFIGSLGCLMMAVGSLVATDDSTFNSVRDVQEVVMLLVGGAVLVAFHLARSWWRAHRAPLSVPHRRRTDFGDLDEPKAGA